MKNLLLLFSVLLSSSLSAVEYGNLTNSSQEILLNDGDTFVVLASSENSGGSFGNNFGVRIETDSGTYILYFNDFNGTILNNNDNYGISSTSRETRTICGPGKVSLQGNFFLSYELRRASEVEYKQANIVSLPLDDVGNGTHNIVVEASDDLQSWTPVHSSSIGGDKAFFRTRVVEAE
tara:strand:- start:7150 stop:7683 length:534 start_codon:yes stop_codon:yes gene_type:complete